jgi:Domain of unknown function (DUF4276)
MPASHFEFLVEEPSMEAFLKSWLPRCLPDDRTFHIHVFQGKTDLLRRLEPRLFGYAAWLPADWRIVVLVDRDNDDCQDLKTQLEDMCARAELATRRVLPGANWRSATCLAIEELEAWYFGEWTAVQTAYSNVSRHIPSNARYRNSDKIMGGTWEAFERVMQRSGYFKGGLEKVRAAREIGAQIEVERSVSPSFRHLAHVLTEAAQ